MRNRVGFSSLLVKRIYKLLQSREGVCGGARGGEKSGYSVWQSSRAAYRGAFLC